LSFGSKSVQARAISRVRLGIPRRLFATKATELAVELEQFESAIAELTRAGAFIVDPCDVPSAEQILEVRSSVFPTEFKDALNAFLLENGAPSGIASITDLVRWNEAHPQAIPYGQSLLIAASETEGLGSAQYRDDRRRDVALSRQAGIDTAMEFSGIDALIAPMGTAAKLTGKAGAPVLAIPIGLGSNGSPVGVTIFSSVGTDHDLLETGMAITKVIGRSVLPKL
jgi:amidase